jgi:oligopeptide transport system substrate-binding protein
MRKRLLGIMASAAVIAAACSGATTSSAPAASVDPGASAPAETPAASVSDMADEQILRIDLGNEPPTLDPSQAQDSTSISVLHAITRPLVYLDKDLKAVPSLAESWDVSEDGQTITFHLRDGAKYSNGDPIVAGDLVYSWKRLVDPRTAAPYSYVTAEIVGAPDLLDMAGADPAPTDAEIDAALAGLGVAAPDDQTFVVSLNTPASYFVTAATLWVFVPIQQSWIESPGATEAGNYVGSGPFILDTWNHNSEIVLKPNPNWYGEAPKLQEIHMTMTAEPAQAQAAFEAGELDMVLPPTEDILRIQADPVLGPQVVQNAQFGITYYDFNNGNGVARCTDAKVCPTMNKEFRIALTQAIDKQAFIDATFSGVGVIANSMVMPGIPGYLGEDYHPYQFDVAAAQAHMATALSEIGVASAADLGPLKVGFNTGSGHELKVAFMAEAWRLAFGLETDQIGSEWGVFLTQRQAGEYDIARDGWGADYPHANNQLAGIYTCGGGNNASQTCIPEVDALMAQAAAEADQDTQEQLYKQAETLIFDAASTLPLRFSIATYEVAPYVAGVTQTGSDSQLPGDQFFETIYILKH